MTMWGIFAGLAVGAVTIGAILWWSRFFRQTMRSIQQSEQQKHLPMTKTRRIRMGLGGLGLILIGGLWLAGINHFHYWWLDWFSEWGTALVVIGLVLIVRAVKPKKKSNSTFH